MATSLYHKYAVSSGVSYRSVRSALDQLSESDLSVSSPVTDGAPEVAISVPGADTDPGGFLELRVEGHDGDWTKTSEQAVKRAAQSVDGVGELVDSDGGYDAGE